MSKKKKKQRKSKKQSTPTVSKKTPSQVEEAAAKKAKLVSGEALVQHKHKPDDPDDWELKLQNFYDWAQHNATGLLLGLAVLLAVAGVWLVRSENQRERERTIWSELQAAQSFSARTGNERAGLDSLKVVYQRYQGTRGWEMVGLAYANALVENGDSAEVSEARALLERLATGELKSPSNELARGALDRLRTREADRKRVLDGLGGADKPVSPEPAPEPLPEEQPSDEPEQPSSQPEQPADVPEQPTPGDSTDGG